MRSIVGCNKPKAHCTEATPRQAVQCGYRLIAPYDSGEVSP
jgi:hypothetical protein